ncbi:unnamed protein product [Urochloa humidicola]
MDAATPGGAGHGSVGAQAIGQSDGGTEHQVNQSGPLHSGRATDRDAMEGHGGISAAMEGHGPSSSGGGLQRASKIPPKKKPSAMEGHAPSSSGGAVQRATKKKPSAAAGKVAEKPPIRTKRCVKRSALPDSSVGTGSPSISSDSDPFMPPKKMSRQGDTGCSPSSSRITRSSCRRGGLPVQPARRGGRVDGRSKPRKSGRPSVRFELRVSHNLQVLQHLPLKNQKLNVRCAPDYVLKVLAMLNQQQRNYVTRKGFGSLFEMTVDGLETRGLLGWLLENTDPSDMTIRAGPGKIGGLPEKSQWSRVVDEAKTFMASLDFPSGVITVDRMKEEVAKGGADDLTMRCLFLILFNRLLLCKGGGEISNEHILWTRQIEHFADFDWCHLIYNDLCHAVRKWHSRDTHHPTATVYGCSIVILIYYLDHLYANAAPDMKSATARFKYFDSATIQGLIKADHKDRKWGVCDFHSRTQTCYDHGPSIYIPRLRGLLAHKISSCPEEIIDRFENFFTYYDNEIGKLATAWEDTRRMVVRRQNELAHNFGEMIDTLLRADNNNLEDADAGGSGADHGTGNEGGNLAHAAPGATSTVNPAQLHEEEPSQSTNYSNLDSLTSHCVNTSRRGREYEGNSPQYTQDLPDDQLLTET